MPPFLRSTPEKKKLKQAVRSNNAIQKGKQLLVMPIKKSTPDYAGG